MATTMATSITFLCALFLLPTQMVSAKKTYIVAMNHQNKPDSFLTNHDWHTATVESLSSAATADSLLYSYKTAYHGFAAVLEEEEAESLRRSDSVLAVYEDRVYSLHTTRTPHFLGLDSNAGIWEGHEKNDLDRAAENVIIGVLDTGIWPESKSFDDTGIPAIPLKWRGKCEAGPDFNPNVCNKKLIGARCYSKGYEASLDSTWSSTEIITPRDHEGHGTHTASTAAGSKVANANLFGYANGTARGMAFRSRVASYKVCWLKGCFGSDILAAMEQAIYDGVDILSLSIGGETTEYYQDPVALGAFAAMEKGIFVSCSAGNSGPFLETVANGAPWITTVGAGSLDRTFPAYAFLGNNVKYAGVSLYSGKGMGNRKVPLVYDNKTTTLSLFCVPGSLNKALVKGKVVVCDRGQNPRVEKGLVVRKAGGVGMILANMPTSGGEELLADTHLIPAVTVGAKVGNIIKNYAQSDPNPTVLLTFGGTVLNVHPTPVVAAFSSRGPYWISPQILKPDIIGPGINILAAWTGDMGPSTVVSDTRRTEFAVLSGTSMSCPHLSGIAALVKAVHPKWSPSAIRSALMTTTYNLDNNNSPIHDAADNSIANPFASGAGHVDPKKALSPGLIYDITKRQYINFICSLNYTQNQLQLIVKNPKFNCSRKVYSDPGQLNYPSFSPVFSTNRVVRYTRELTNVGPAPSSYIVTIKGHPSVDIAITPKKLNFAKVGQKLKYTVTFVAKDLYGPTDHPYGFGSIVWASAQHQVRSPISFLWAHKV